EVEATAIDVYRYLLQTGMACALGNSSVDVKHNLATLLAAQNYVNAAALLWEEAYRERATDQMIRRAFAFHLDRLDREGDAAKVLIGQELPELELTPEPVPDRFGPDHHPWWENLSVEEYPP